MDVKFDFSGRVALVTGAGSGIGRASAEAFGASGATVAVADISAERGGTTVDAIVAAGGAAEYFAVDVADESQVQSLVAAIVERFGGLDFAHNNAGIEGINVPLAEVPSDNFRHVIEVDLTSVFYSMKAEIPVMLERGGGAIVNTASVSGLIGGYDLSTYTAAKHGVVGLTRAAAMDYGAKGIRINALCPGVVDTPFIRDTLPQRAIDRLVFASPIGRMADAAEMAQATLWLCSDGASYMVGHALAVDGGVVLSGTGTRFDDLGL